MKIHEITTLKETGTIPQTLPAKPGTEPVQPGYVRLYHQTDADSLRSIEQGGLKLANARGIEGPRAIYASETGFYGKPESRPTLEFQVPKDKWESPFVLMDVPPANIIAAHYPWQAKARYLLDRPNKLQQTLDGDFDDLAGDYALAVEYIKNIYGK